ncbi:MAG: hypothetical protein CEO22_351 [Candidatus Berkelbacteria bacterium Gr01-1014_85]|uniref:Cytidylate kinase n=1 Tax=Candidatus Berkelbacteria bacterium Gr01-1014_85 TaxID=2017150 RepID=A0A554JBX5_9BACT|nr:MAG: hypothetical protein CEO22_351 [Candidatus Berkelbacteria bacterium Gr01-1014_85]
MRITISGLSAVGTTSTAKGLATVLGWPISTFTLRNLAQDRGVSFETIHQELKKHDPSIDHDLDRHHIANLKQQPKLIVATDLAGWLDDPKMCDTLGVTPPQIDFRIWLDASPAIRAKRFFAREQGSEAALNRYDQEIIEHYKLLYGVDILNHDHFDLCLVTDQYSLEEVIELCRVAIETKVNND